MLLKDPERMTELFALLHKAQSVLYQEKELNEAIRACLKNKYCTNGKYVGN